jgi:hypothetical protein
MRGDNLYRTKEGKKIASFKDLSMSTSTWREINAYIEPNEKMSKADIMMKTKRGPEKIGEIEGNVRKLNTQRACAIYGFLFEFFA